MKQLETSLPLPPLDKTLRFFIFSHIVHFFVKNEHLVMFEVYSATKWDGRNNTSGICYLDKDEGIKLHDTFDPEHCCCKLRGTLQWRGCWEGRMYFPDSEYWAEELKELSDLYSTFIEKKCKALLGRE